MAAFATSSTMRTSLARVAATKGPFVHASKAFRPSLLTKSSPLSTAGTPMRLMRLERSFHSSAPKQILPPLPQKIHGDVNDPAPIPEPHPTHGSYHWDFERLVAVGLVPLTIAPFVSGTLNPTMDAILCATILVHSHVGFQSIIIDYVPNWRMPRIRQLFWWGLRLGTVLVGVGLYEFETNDIGLTELIRQMWTA